MSNEKIEVVLYGPGEEKRREVKSMSEARRIKTTLEDKIRAHEKRRVVIERTPETQNDAP